MSPFLKKNSHLMWKFKGDLPMSNPYRDDNASDSREIHTK